MEISFNSSKEFKKKYKGQFFDADQNKIFTGKAETGLINGKYFISSGQDFDGAYIYDVCQISLGNDANQFVTYVKRLRTLTGRFRSKKAAKYYLQLILITDKGSL